MDYASDGPIVPHRHVWLDATERGVKSGILAHAPPKVTEGLLTSDTHLGITGWMKQARARIVRRMHDLRGVAFGSALTLDGHGVSTEARLAVSIVLCITLVGVVAAADTFGWLAPRADVPARSVPAIDRAEIRQSTSRADSSASATAHTQSLAPLVKAATAPLDLGVAVTRSDDLLQNASGWCSAQQASVGGRPGDRAAVSLRLATFRSPDMAARVVTTLTPATLGELLPDRARMVEPLVPVDPPMPLPAAVAGVFSYGKRITPAAGQLPGTQALPVQLVLINSGPVVGLVEGIGLSPAALQSVTNALEKAARDLPVAGC
jgi:hypothetical protein